MDNNNIAIKVTDLGKRYTIGKQKEATLRSTLSSAFQSAAKKGDEFWAIKGLNFEIKRGEIVGIIGKNGAGKSTLLKVLSQITKPTTGRIEINGRVASLLEVGTGFHPELTGRENIFLNGTILGMTRKEVSEKLDAIIEFSGVAKFIDTPVKHYSSGMYVRLAFSVAAHLDPEILIIDEVLAVGDAEFQKKCLGKMEDVAKEGRTVLFVSHNMSAIQSFCTKGLLVDKGELVYFGKLEKALSTYAFGDGFKNNLNLKDHPRSKGHASYFKFTKLEVKGNYKDSAFPSRESITLIVSFITTEPVMEMALGFSITDHEDRTLIECRSYRQLSNLNYPTPGEHSVTVKFTPNLNSGVYSLNFGAISKQGELDYLNSAYVMEISHEKNDDSWYNEDLGQLIVDHEWKVE